MRTTSYPLYGLILMMVLGCLSTAKASDAPLIGTGVGAALGGLAGSQIGKGTGEVVSTGIGIAVGGYVGNEIGHTIDNQNTYYPSGAGDFSYATHDPLIYNNYAPNYVAPPVPPPTYVNQDVGTYCRPFSQNIEIDGQIVESYGTACLQPDGSWRVVP